MSLEAYFVLHADLKSKFIEVSSMFVLDVIEFCKTKIYKSLKS